MESINNPNPILSSANEKQLQQIIDAVPAGLIRVSSLGLIEMINTQVEIIFGYGREELIGQPIELLIPKSSAIHHQQHREHYFNSPSPRAMGAGRELFALHKNGSEFPIEIGLAPIDIDGDTKVLASVVDISARVNAENALNESRERLETATRLNCIGVWELNCTTNKLYWNDAMFEIYGRSKEHFKNEYQDWQQACHPEDIEETEARLSQSINDLTPFIGKFRIVRPDGSVRYIRALANSKKMRNNELRILGTNIDVTREVEIQEKINEVESLRSAVVAFSEDAIISKTPYGKITSWNLGAEKMFGYSAEEAVGKFITDLLFPDDLKSEENFLLSQVQAGIVVSHYETIRRCKDGKLIDISVTLSPIKNKQGQVIGASAIKRDITEVLKNAKLLKERQELLEQSNLELEKINKELQNFAYIASHDLRSPLRGIAQLSSWIDEDLASGDFEKVQVHTSFLRGRISRMEKLLEDLLRYYRAGRTASQLGEVDLDFMVKELFDLQNTNNAFELIIPKPLPTLITYVPPLEQIISNLFSNALKHHDLEKGTITVTAHQINETFLEIKVSDDGPGIPHQYHGKVFEIFQTLKTRDEMESSGIGLSLVKKIVESVGGSIRIESVGRGSSFIFIWPLKIPAANQPNAFTLREGKE